jgi:catechol 2,3-dioxygenase-like lactoylglutathione lyase family enzyme
MATDIVTDVVKFHLSLNASNLMKSIAFYRTLFGIEPAKVRNDYAKFEVAEPPVILSLAAVAPTPGGTLNHVGIRVLDSAALVAMQARLEQAGYATQREEAVECCYSKQTKFWVADPDRTLWEIYVLHGDADEEDHAPSAHHGVAGNSAMATQDLSLPVLSSAAEPRQRVVWAHMLVQPLPTKIAHVDASVDEVQLHGTFNMAVDRDALATFLKETRRVLKPGSLVTAHVLTTNGPTIDRPSLPGPAALVDRVYGVGDVTALFAEAGFVNVQLTKLGEKPCFQVGTAEMRETKLAATAPAATCCGGDSIQVVYKGPMRETIDGAGNRFTCGVSTSISLDAWESLRAAGIADQFVRLGGAASKSGCCS